MAKKLGENKDGIPEVKGEEDLEMKREELEEKRKLLEVSETKAKLELEIKELDDIIDSQKEEEKDLNKKETSKIKKMVKKDSKVKKIRVMIGEKEYQIPESQIVDLSKKDYKIKEDTKKIKEGEVCVLYLRESGTSEFKYVRPQNGMFIVDGRYYHIKSSCIHTIGKKRIPLAVIPEWSFIPLSKTDYAEVLGANEQDAQMLIIKSLENAEVVKIQRENEPAKKQDPKLVIWIIIAGVVALYFLQKYSGG